MGWDGDGVNWDGMGWDGMGDESLLLEDAHEARTAVATPPHIVLALSFPPPLAGGGS